MTVLSIEIKKANQYYDYPFDCTNTMTIRTLARHTVSSSIPYDGVCARTSSRRLLRVQSSPQECSVSQSGSTIEELIRGAIHSSVIQVNC